MTDKQKDWKLSKITIEYENFGEHKGKYIGSIRFENGEYESFQFKLYPEMTEKYIKLLSGDIVLSANDLGNRLIESLELTPLKE